MGEPGCPSPQRLGSWCPPIPRSGPIVKIDAVGGRVTVTGRKTPGAFALPVSPGGYPIKAAGAGAVPATAGHPLVGRRGPGYGRSDCGLRDAVMWR